MITQIEVRVDLQYMQIGETIAAGGNGRQGNRMFTAKQNREPTSGKDSGDRVLYDFTGLFRGQSAEQKLAAR